MEFIMTMESEDESMMDESLVNDEMNVQMEFEMEKEGFSWDFTNAIENIQKHTGKKSMQKSIQEKIEKLRKTKNSTNKATTASIDTAKSAISDTAKSAIATTAKGAISDTASIKAESAIADTASIKAESASDSEHLIDDTANIDAEHSNAASIDSDTSSIDSDAASIDSDTSSIDSGTAGIDSEHLKAKNDPDTYIKNEMEEEDSIVEEERLKIAVAEHTNEQSRVEKEMADAYFEKNPFDVEERKEIGFEELRLCRPLLRGVGKLGFVMPTPIQQQAIPLAMAGKDICASAQTGSGKTAAFLLPILERLQYRKTAATRVLIICPVRELATQCQSMLEQLAVFTDITCSLAVGGLPLKAQEVELRNRPDVVVCTPGRMIDHLRNSRSVHLDDLEILVLDEADRLLEMGFADELDELIKSCPKARQTLLFSATMTSKIDQLIKLSMKRPVRISTDPLYDVAKHLVQEFVRIRPNRENDREAILLALCTRTFKTNTIVFLEYKKHAHRMMVLFGLAGIKAAELHGNLCQEDRLQSLQQFRDGTVDILLCTDVAARGIDVKGVHAVINYEMPKDITTYVHRVGRTARAGRMGRAVTLTSESRRLITKQVSRNCVGVVKSRAIPPQIIEQWSRRIEQLEPDILTIFKEESMERKIRSAEKEVTRAHNLVQHKEEIFSRPARTWFQSEKAKKDAKQLSTPQTDNEDHSDLKQAKRSLDGPKRVHKLPRVKRRRLAMLQQQEKMFMQNENDASHGPAPFTANSVASAARSSKKSQREKLKEYRNISLSEIQQRQSTKRAEKLKKKGNFDTDASTKPSKVKEFKTPKPSSEYQIKDKKSEIDLRKGGKKSVNSFKSKKRFNRRK